MGYVINFKCKEAPSYPDQPRYSDDSAYYEMTSALTPSACFRQWVDSRGLRRTMVRPDTPVM